MISYLRLGYGIEKICDNDNKEYVVIKDYIIRTGRLENCKCNVAFESVSAVPYFFPAAIHTSPASLLNGVNVDGTQASPLGEDWIYWSRQFSKPPTPQNIVAHIATIFRDVI